MLKRKDTGGGDKIFSAPIECSPQELLLVSTEVLESPKPLAASSGSPGLFVHR
jgi:hypothetical protein